MQQGKNGQGSGTKAESGQMGAYSGGLSDRFLLCFGPCRRRELFDLGNLGRKRGRPKFGSFCLRMVERTSKRVAMPVKMRVECDGAIYHVMSRGDRREDIFLDDADRQDFLRTQRGGRVDGEEGGEEGL